MKPDLSMMTNEDFYNVLIEMRDRGIISNAMAHAINELIVWNEPREAIRTSSPRTACGKLGYPRP